MASGQVIYEASVLLEVFSEFFLDKILLKPCKLKNLRHFTSLRFSLINRMNMAEICSLTTKIGGTEKEFFLSCSAHGEIGFPS